MTETLSTKKTAVIDPGVALPPEQPGCEFGYNFFEDLLPVEVGEIVMEGVVSCLDLIKPDPDTFFKDIDHSLPLKK